MNKIIIILSALCISIVMQAQIGYQVALLDTATGEPRANETVSVSISITNSAGDTIYSGTQSATTNDFGILSLSVGDANTFTGVDWSKLPFFLSATVDGVLIGRTQILNVPVAEHAKHYGTLTKEILMSKEWVCQESAHKVSIINFSEEKVNAVQIYYDENKSFSYSYSIDGNVILALDSSQGMILHYDSKNNILISSGDRIFR